MRFLNRLFTGNPVLESNKFENKMQELIILKIPYKCYNNVIMNVKEIYFTFIIKLIIN